MLVEGKQTVKTVKADRVREEEEEEEEEEEGGMVLTCDSRHSSHMVWPQFHSAQGRTKSFAQTGHARGSGRMMARPVS